ncbi:MAG: aminoacyl-tRNA hydrolase [Bacilli bacterium]|nr:aminoacyl-tRNA hydrolase [Bacilli bacterium]
MKLIVGLGNPGKEYEHTRHNVGFDVIDFFASKVGASIDKDKFQGLYTKGKVDGEDIILLKPQKFINLSGDVMRKYADYFKVNERDILVIHDDLDLEVGKIKLKERSSSGGHNGMKNIEANFKNNEYKQLKIGISNNKESDTKDYVLGKFSKDDREKIEEAIKKSYDIIIDYINLDFNELQNKYNKR